MQIIIVAYNRVNSLKRLLESLLKATNNNNIDLTISVDFSDINQEIISLYDSYHWKHGSKKIILHKQYLGLKNHMLSVLKLAASNPNPTLILEDDLYITNGYFNFIEEAFSFYIHDKNIAGISLYNQPYHQLTELPFFPLYNGSDVYFMQYASSSGFIIFPQQAQSFLNWFNTSLNKFPDKIAIPDKISNWPNTSWKKWFCAWLIHENKYIVFPRASFTTNFGDPGTHHQSKSNQFQSILWAEYNNNPKLSFFKDNISIYDCYMEHIPINDVSFDLYGQKPQKHIQTLKVITSKPMTLYEKSFGLNLYPVEQNYFLNNSGNDLFLTNTSNITFKSKTNQKLIRYFIPYSWIKLWIKSLMNL